MPSEPTPATPIGFYWTEGRSGVGIAYDSIPPLKSGSGVGIPSAPAVLFADGSVLMPSLEACEALQGFPKGWTAAVDTTSRNPRWPLLGNAVSVPVARWVIENIKRPRRGLNYKDFAISPGRNWPDAAYGHPQKHRGVAASDKPLSIPTPSIAAFRDKSWRPLSVRALTGFISRAKEGNLRFPSGFLSSLDMALQRQSEIVR